MLLTDDDDDDEAGKVEGAWFEDADVDIFEADGSQVPDGIPYREDIVNGDAHGD